MTVFDKIKTQITDFINSTFVEEPDDETFFKEMGADGYQVSGNTALDMDKLYAPKEKTTVTPKVVTSPAFKGYEVIVSEPRSYEDAMTIVKHLKDRKTVILNLHLLDKEQSLRIVDFLCGATHALTGNQQKIGDSVFIFTPSNINLTGESQQSKLIRDAYWSQPQ